jgi:hypothetical protein
MAKPLRTLLTRVRGFWNPVHTILEADGSAVGILKVRRNRWGLVLGAEYRPEEGEVLQFRRDPGILRAQFSLWTEDGEWLGSSLRWHVGRRQIDLWTGSKPYRVVPRKGLGRGWRVIASRTGEVATIRLGLLSRGARIDLQRKMDPELLLFSYFLGSLTANESFYPSWLDRTIPSPARPSTSS